MKKTDKVDIDKLFREGLDSEQAPTVFPESDWAKLEERLDRHKRRKRAIFWLRTSSGIAAVLVLALTIWTLWPVHQNTSTTPAIVQEAEQPANQAPEQPTISNKKTETAPEKESVPPTNLATNEPVQIVPSKPRLVQRPVKPVSDSLLIAGLKSPRKLSITLSNPTEPLATKLKPMPSFKPATTTQPIVEDVQFNEHPKSHPLVLSLFVAPSYNDVNNISNGKLGSDVGLLVSMALTKKWSLSTGAIYAKKLYEAPPSEYHLNTGDFYPEKVDADCRVLDIPLNLNYKLYSTRNMTLSLGTGISSYIMLKENYNFVYTDYTHDVQVVNENKHWLSVFNVQANIERKLSSKVSVSFQPYLKLPMKDVGYAKVRLQSFGLALSANLGL